MKKRIIQFLTDACAAVIKEEVSGEFAIDCAVNFNLLEGKYQVTFKSQGVAKDRQIRSFIDGLQVGYLKAMAKVQEVPA